MNTPPRLTRRAALGATAALPLTAALGGTALAAGNSEDGGLGFAPYRSFDLGDMQVTTLLAGTSPVPDPQTIFGMNVSEEEFADASRAAFIPTDVAQFFFTPTLVKTGDDIILFDTGTDPAGLKAALSAAGHTPADITKVVLTHMHGDHIGGLMDGTSETFEGASYYTGATEFDAWASTGNEAFEAKVRPLADAGKIEMIDDGASVTSGVTAMMAPGHTPGHMAYMLESGGKQLVLIADVANHYVWSLAYPDWEVRFDQNKEQAAETRRKMLGMIAAERIPMIGYHMPFPALGYVDTRGDGFHYVPATYQQML
ncbi:MBL fold metallo-hydrolase [Aliiroseovarius sp. PTFE2010]|uniref:MBL fold metallo-hydrolase n=1 Tax=Aliiroseovarius sp. PTFE2010 TaxID=3417190 RepID=UPI003CE774B3